MIFRVQFASDTAEILFARSLSSRIDQRSSYSTNAPHTHPALLPLVDDYFPTATVSVHERKSRPPIPINICCIHSRRPDQHRSELRQVSPSSLLSSCAPYMRKASKKQAAVTAILCGGASIRAQAWLLCEASAT